MKKAEFRALVKKLRRKARKARHLAGQMRKAGSMEAFKMALGEQYGFDRAAGWIEEILDAGNEE